MLASQASTETTRAAAAGTLSGLAQANALTSGGGGTAPSLVMSANYIPVFTDALGNHGNSVMYQSGSFVGFNTTSPSFGIDLNSNVFAIGPKAALPGGGGTMRFRDDSGTVRWSFGVPGSVGATDFFLYNNANGHAPFYIQAAASSYSLYLHANGNIGIGTTNPAHRLDVAGDINASSNIAATGTITAGAFSGDGSGLIHVSATNAASLGGIPALSYARIDQANTLTGNQMVSGGDLAITSGDISLPQTTSALVGVINLGGIPFVHSCCGSDSHNTFLGPGAGNFTTTGVRNTATGYQAFVSNTSGSNNTANGAWALYSNSTGGINTASGFRTLYANTSGTANTAHGYQALYSNTTGGQNTAGGVSALEYNTLGNSNTAHGYSTLFWNTTGNNNTAVGTEALRDNCPNVAGDCAGNNNTALGYLAGVTVTGANSNRSGANNTFIGALSGPGTPTQLNNSTAIGYKALVSASNALVLGGTGDFAVRVGIGTEIPTERLDVAGNVKASGSVTAASFTGDGAGLTNVSAITAVSATTAGSANALSCAGCVTGANLATGTITGSNIAGGTITGSNINASANILPEAVMGTAATLGINTFTGSQTVRAYPNQNTNLEEWQDSSGTPVAKINDNGVFTGPMGVLLHNPAFVERPVNKAGSGWAQVADGMVILMTGTTANSFVDIQGAASHGGLDHNGSFLSVRISTTQADSTDVFYVLAGGRDGSNFRQGFGFKGVGNALKGVSILNGNETVIDLATTFSSNSHHASLAVRRPSSVEFYVNGVLKGRSTTNLPASESAPEYELRAENGTDTTYFDVSIEFMTIGIPMF